MKLAIMIVSDDGQQWLIDHETILAAVDDVTGGHAVISDAEAFSQAAGDAVSSMVGGILASTAAGDS